MKLYSFTSLVIYSFSATYRGRS